MARRKADQRTSQTGGELQAQSDGRDETEGEVSYAEAGQGILTLRGVRSVIMPLPAFTFLLQIVYEHSPEIVKYAFYDAGYRAGFATMQAQGGPGGNPERTLLTMIDNFQRMGYGRLEVTKYDLSKPEIEVRGTHLFETDLAREAGIFRTPRAVSHYTRGVLGGFVSCLLGEEVICEELQSEYRGDGFSLFVIVPYQAGVKRTPCPQP